MKSAAVISYVSSRVRKNLQDRATDLGLSLSRYVCRVLEDDCEQKDEICKPLAELKRRLKSAENPDNCTTFETKEDFMKYIDGVAANVRKN
jgi:hypothetical protein